MNQESFVRRLQHFALMIYISLLYFFGITSSKSLTPSICKSKECTNTASNFNLWMDVNVDPCHDFYRYACGNYKKPVVFGYYSIHYGRINQNINELWDFLEKGDSDDEPDAVHKARKLYGSCLNMELKKEQLKHLNIQSLTSQDNESVDSILNWGGVRRPCLRLVRSKFYLAISYLHTQKEKYRNANIQITEMSKYVRKTFMKIIEQATWMDARTKRKALRKLAFMGQYVAYPADIDELRELLEELYHNVNIDENIHPLEIMSKLQTILDFNLKKATKEHEDNPSKRINKFYFISDFENISPYYQKSINLIGFPACAIEPSLYGNELKSLDFGGIGAVLGHEMMHAFDPQGRTMNEWGIQENWWSETSSRIYNEKLKCYNVPIKENTNKESSLPEISTIKEDFSDNGAFYLALRAYRSYVSEKGEEPRLVHFENLTNEQLFTLEFARFYCKAPLSGAYIRKSTDPHSSNEARVNGVLRNSKDFAEIWKCPKGSKMNPSAKCSFW